MKKIRISFLVILLFTLLPISLIQQFVSEAAEEGAGRLVYVIPVENEVERGLQAFLERTTREAEEENADHIILEIDTPGGRVDSANQIAELLQNLDTPTTSFVTAQALSAGSYIALNTDNIYMKPQATMGASGVITSDGNAADEKAQSAWIAAMRSAAESKNRDPLYAAAMADASIDLPKYGAPEGEFLTLGPNDAVEVGYAEGIVDHRTELLNELNLAGAEVIETETTFAEEIARFLTNPVVVPILLSLASIGLIVELYSPGFGIPGSIGLLSLILFFYGHVVAGLAGYEAIILLVLGIGLVVAEIFVPGGILGFLGIGGVVGALFLSSANIGHMALSIGIALAASIAVAIFLFRRLGFEKGFFRKIILNDATTTEQGYVSSRNRLDLIGQTGIALTSLRPSGTAIFDDERIDVVSEGGYINKDSAITIVKTEGSRVVVREATNNQTQGE